MLADITGASIFVVPLIAAATAVVTSLIAGRTTVAASKETHEGEESSLSFKTVVKQLEKRIDDLDAEVKKCHTDKEDLADQVGSMEAANARLREEVGYLSRRVKELEGASS